MLNSSFTPLELLYLLHHPKMGQTQYLQRCGFHKLKDSADDLSEDAGASDDIIVRAEDDRALDEFHGQAVE